MSTISPGEPISLGNWRGAGGETTAAEILALVKPAGGGDPPVGDTEPQFTGAQGQTAIFQPDFDDTQVYGSWTTLGETDLGTPRLIPEPSPEFGTGWGCNDASDYSFITGRSGSGQALRVHRDGLNDGSARPQP